MLGFPGHRERANQEGLRWELEAKLSAVSNSASLQGEHIRVNL
jgi:hypothetical protein